MLMYRSRLGKDLDDITLSYVSSIKDDSDIAFYDIIGSEAHVIMLYENKLLSKIPVIGKIIIPKDIGEGLFGVSFKIKGMPGKMKTTINPIKTLTPRFITKALEKQKKSK